MKSSKSAKCTVSFTNTKNAAYNYSLILAIILILSDILVETLY